MKTYIITEYIQEATGTRTYRVCAEDEPAAWALLRDDKGELIAEHFEVGDDALVMYDIQEAL